MNKASEWRKNETAFFVLKKGKGKGKERKVMLCGVLQLTDGLMTKWPLAMLL